MKAADCAWHKTCRYQQRLAKLEREMGGTPETCWAERIHCHDRANHMEERCVLFRPAAKEKRSKRYEPKKHDE